MLGLLVPTDASWSAEALSDLDGVLRDHAHCEMKAAVHAMSLVARHPDDLGLVRKLVALAQEELRHFDRVVEILAARGIALGPPPVDEYAASLRKAARGDLVDRLLVASIIEARSCERFKLLGDALGSGHVLGPFYAELFAAEARHHRELVDLAIAVSSEDVALQRLRELARLEAEIVRGQAAASHRATIHG